MSILCRQIQTWKQLGLFFQADVNSLQIDAVSFEVGAHLQAPVNYLQRQMQTRKQLGLLFMEMGTIKQVGFLYRQI
jgi:hypothetical protein